MDILNHLRISEPELVRTDAQFGDYTLDGSFVPLKNPDGSYRFINTSYSEKPNFHKFGGTPENIFQKSEVYNMDYNGYCCAEPSGIWIMSAYKYDDVFLVGFAIEN